MKTLVSIPALFCLALSLLPFCSSAPFSCPSSWLRKCWASSSTSITTLEVLPGRGWDNLRNMDMGRVMAMSYIQCQTTEDGIYFIPDEVFVIPYKETGVEIKSEIISSWLEHKSTTSFSINEDESFFPELNGKFSTENQRIKTHQVKDSSTTARVQVRNLIYSVKAYPGSFIALDECFVQHIKEIADAIENNQTRNADYLSEEMVLDYGTHVITSVDVGATLVEEDYLTSTYVSNGTTDISSITAQAKFNFMNKFGIGINNTITNVSLQGYQSNIKSSFIQDHGSISFYPGITLQKWQESTRNNLVAIDRSGFPLHYFINIHTIPDLPTPTIEKVASTVSNAIERYYKVNTRPGCVDTISKNFNFQANVDDSSCEGPATNLSFGGVYQVCTHLSSDADPLCDTPAQKNPDTGDFSCSSPYTPTLLRSEEKQQSYTTYDCYDQEYDCGFLYLWTCYRQVCKYNYRVRSARIDTYWCSVNGEAPEDSGYLFGGFYSPSLINPLTKAKSCPQSFTPVKFLSDGQMICVSKDYETGTRFSVPFGGLFSCQASNPLANSQQRCPHKFSQHLLTVSDGCEILYCVQSGLFTEEELLPIHLPPFTKPQLDSMQATNNVMVMTAGDKSWDRVGPTKGGKLAEPQENHKLMLKLDPEMDQMSGWDSFSDEREDWFW